MPIGRDMIRVIAGATPVIAVLVAAAFVVPPDAPWLLRQSLLFVVGCGGIAVMERLFFATPAARLPAALGIRLPTAPAFAVAVAVSAAMWLYLPAVALASGTALKIAPDWIALLVGVLLVNGLAEETIHRAFVFGHLRRLMPFAAAAAASAAVFALQHAYLVATIGLVAGLASVLLALLLSFPLALLYERSAQSILGPVVVHTSVNGSYLIFADASRPDLLIAHMVVVLLAVYVSFLILPRQTTTAAPDTAMMAHRTGDGGHASD